MKGSGCRVSAAHMLSAALCLGEQTSDLTQNRANRTVTLFNQLKCAPIEPVLHLFIIQPRLMSDRRMQVAAIVAMLHRLIPHIVRSPVNRATLNPRAREP